MQSGSYECGLIRTLEYWDSDIHSGTGESGKIHAKVVKLLIRIKGIEGNKEARKF